MLSSCNGSIWLQSLDMGDSILQKMTRIESFTFCRPSEWVMIQFVIKWAWVFADAAVAMNKIHSHKDMIFFLPTSICAVNGPLYAAAAAASISCINRMEKLWQRLYFWHGRNRSCWTIIKATRLIWLEFCTSFYFHFHCRILCLIYRLSPRATLPTH